MCRKQNANCVRSEAGRRALSSRHVQKIPNRCATHLSCMLNKSLPPMRNTSLTARAPLYTAMTAKWPPKGPSSAPDSGHTRIANALSTTSDARVWACKLLAVCRHSACDAIAQQAKNATVVVTARPAVHIAQCVSVCMCVRFSVRRVYAFPRPANQRTTTENIATGATGLQSERSDCHARSGSF